MEGIREYFDINPENDQSKRNKIVRAMEIKCKHEPDACKSVSFRFLICLAISINQYRVAEHCLEKLFDRRSKTEAMVFTIHILGLIQEKVQLTSNNALSLITMTSYFQIDPQYYVPILERYIQTNGQTDTFVLNFLKIK